MTKKDEHLECCYELRIVVHTYGMVSYSNTFYEVILSCMCHVG